MAFSTHFQSSIDLVDDTKILSFVIDSTYDSLEYSISGLKVRGGSEAGCEAGGAALLEEMGFRFYAPHQQFWKIPSSIETGISIPKRINWIPAISTFLVYGHSWGGTNSASRALLNDNYRRWATLVGVANNSYPAGHRWKNIIENSAEFFSRNPKLIRINNSGNETFNLAAIQGTASWDTLAEYCAAFMLDAGLNEFNRTHFDPIDGDDTPSNLVYPFALEVVTRMRAGTEAIGPFAVHAGVPDSEIGVYAYAGHRLPPSQPYKPGVYSQVALAFNSTDLSYQELIDQHGALAEAVSIREYLDTQVWSNGRPLLNARAKSGYFNRYDAYKASGAVSVVSEFTANWLVNIVQSRAHILKFRTGVVDWSSIIENIVDDIFGGDTKVTELYTLWSDPSERFHKWSLRASFDIVHQMQPSWYKIYFKQLLTIHYQFNRLDNADHYGIVRYSGDPSDTFEVEITKLLSWVTAVRDSDFLHSYALIRQEANAALNDYPHQKFNAAPEPNWFANPVSPTEADWLSAHAAITAEANRNSALDGTDLVLMAVAPVADRSTLECTMMQSEGGVVLYIVVGPSTVRIEDLETKEIETQEFGYGAHTLRLPQNQRISWAGGLIFMDTFPSARKDPDPQNRNTWLYVPSFSAGQVDLQSGARWAFYDEEPIRKDWNKSTSFPSLGPGQCAVDNNNTRGNIENGNCNRYLSPNAYYTLTSSLMAETEGKDSRIKIIHV